MTDRNKKDIIDIDRIIAEEIMGYCDCTHNNPFSCYDDFYYDKNGMAVRCISDWNPRTNISQALEAVDELLRNNPLRDFVLEKNTGSDNWRAMFFDHGNGDDEHNGWIEVEAFTREMAICQAVLEVVGVM